VKDLKEMQHKILIVDDSKLARMVMASAFRRIRPEWSLSEATNAEEALSAISTGHVEIALIDFNMPGTDGLELVARLRERHQRCRWPSSPLTSRMRLLHGPGNLMPLSSLNLSRMRPLEHFCREQPFV
jgi:CheY-like chemotaxis protein